MSSKGVSEKRLWDWLSQVRGYCDDRSLHMERIENLVGVGAADVSGCYRGKYFDLELKTADRPTRTTTSIIRPGYVRPAQKVWHTLRWLAGGNNFVFLQVGSGSEAWRYLIPGQYVRDLEGKTERELLAMSVCTSLAGPGEVLVAATTYRSTLAKSS